MIWPGAASATVVVVVPPSDVLGLFVAGVDICLVSLEYFLISESRIAMAKQGTGTRTIASEKLVQ